MFAFFSFIFKYKRSPQPRGTNERKKEVLFLNLFSNQFIFVYFPVVG